MLASYPEERANGGMLAEKVRSDTVDGGGLRVISWIESFANYRRSTKSHENTRKEKPLHHGNCGKGIKLVNGLVSVSSILVPRMILTLGVTFQLWPVEVDLAQVARAVSFGLIVEML